MAAHLWRLLAVSLGLACGASASGPPATVFEHADTTPPTVNRPNPPADSTTGNPVAIRAAFADGGTGIDPGTASVLLDGADVTGGASISAKGLTLHPAQALAEGIHHVEATVSDKAGNPGNRLAWRFGVGVPVPVEARVEKGVFRVGGQPYFPMGVYAVSTRASEADKRYLIQAAEAGVNCQLVPETTGPDQLDIMLRHGMKALISLWYPIKAFGEGDARKLDGLLGAVKGHPGVLGWYAEYPNTEPEPIKLYQRVAEAVKRDDPNHPLVWVGSWAAKYKEHFASADVASPYYYPILYEDCTVVTLYERSLRLALDAVRADGKQIWFLTQAFDIRIDRDRQRIIRPPERFRPTGAEMRAMNYLCLAKGVKGLCLYAPGSRVKGEDYCNDITFYSDRWAEALRIASEIRHLSPVLAAGKLVPGARPARDVAAIHYRQFEHAGRGTLIAVNVGIESVTVNWRFTRPVRPKVLFEDRVAGGSSARISDRFGPLQVHVYQWEVR